MIQLQVCPSTLTDGFNTYSPEARKRLFDGKAVSYYMKVPSPSTDSEEAKEAIQNASRISLSGVQPKFSVLVDDLCLRYRKSRPHRPASLLPAGCVQFHFIER